MEPATERTGLDFLQYINERADAFTGRSWVFDCIHEWLLRPEGKRFLLLTGEPGSGKSAIAARLAQFSSGSAVPPLGCPKFCPGFLGSTHFCYARSGTWIDPLRFARSISMQLAHSSQQFAQALKNAGDRTVNLRVTQTVGVGSATGIVIENLVLTGLNPQTAFNSAVIAPLEEIYQQGFTGEVTILVDALDEALEFKGGEIGIPQLLASMNALPPGVRLILTSRRDRRIEGEFLNAEIFPLSSEKYDAENEIDVSAFVKAKLANTVHSTFAEEISRKAGRNFQYVTFLLKELATRGAVSMDGLPAGLDPLYRNSLVRLVGHRDWEREFAPVMGLLSVARESLTEAHLKNFSGFQKREVSSRLADLRPFIEESGTPRAYHFYHQSVVDFLRLHDVEQSGGSLPNEYYLPPAEWHERIAHYYVPNGPTSWNRWDPYGLRYIVSHLAAAVREEANDSRHPLVCRLVELVTNPKYRGQHLRDIDDLPALQRDLVETVRCAALNHDVSSAVPLVRSALALVAFRGQEVRPTVVFDLAVAGEVERAARRLELFEVDEEWVQAALIILAWLGAKSNPAAAGALLSRVKPRGGTAEQLLQQARAAIDGTRPPVISTPLGPVPLEAEIAALVDRFGGRGGDAEMLQRIVNDSLIDVSRGIGGAGYFAQLDSAHLVSFAASYPGGDRYLRQYIAIHSGYQYVQYRNRSLSFVLANIFRHPNPDWILDIARDIATTALAGSSIEFREALPLTVLALKAATGEALAMGRLVELKQQAVSDASNALDQAAAANLNIMWDSRSGPMTGTGAARNGEDSWGFKRRRLAVHAQILACLQGEKASASEILFGASLLQRGFAGFQAPACIMLAEAILVSDADGRVAVSSMLDSALRAAHNVQDASFCLRITSRCNALRERWWGTPDLKQLVTLLVANPRDSQLCAVHRIGEEFEGREPTSLPIPDEVRAAASLASVANIYHGALVDFQRVNPGVDPGQTLPNRTPINVPDPGFATWIAAHLSAELLSSQTLSDSERLSLLQLLVPIASPNPTLLDTVLSRLLLVVRPSDLAVLSELESLAGSPEIRSLEAYEGRLPS